MMEPLPVANQRALLIGLLVALSAPPFALVYGRAWLYQNYLGWPRGSALGISLLSAGLAGVAGLLTGSAIVTLSGYSASTWSVVLGGLAVAIAADAVIVVWAARERRMYGGSLVRTAVLAAAVWWPAAVMLFLVLGYLTLTLGFGQDSGAPAHGG